MMVVPARRLFVVYQAIVAILHSDSCIVGALTSEKSVSFRQGRSSDQVNIAWKLKNPFVVADNFLVAESSDPRTNSGIIGLAQIDVLGTGAVDPSIFNARPMSLNVGKEADDLAWESFENDDTIQIPNGWSSLPWTIEYESMSNAADNRRKNRDEMAHTLEKANTVYELANIWIDPKFENRIETELVRRLVHENQQKKIFLCTFISKARLYRDIFKRCPTMDIPDNHFSRMTRAKIFGQPELICMVVRNPDDEKSVD